MSSVLALLAALVFGTADFLGGLGGRRIDSTLVAACAQVVGIVVVALALAAVDTATGPSAAVQLWSVVAGVGSGIGNAALYRGLARGQMSIVAPTSAVTTAVLPAVVGLSTGDTLAVVGWVGLVLAVPALALVSAAPGAAERVRTSIGWGLAAGLGFGVLFIGLDRAGTRSGAWPAFTSQVVAAVIVAVFAVPAVRRLRGPRRTPGRKIGRELARWALPAGVLASGANLLFLAATAGGSLTVVSVLTALYPAVTVVLAAALLHDRPGRTQVLGLAAATTAVVLVVIGQ